MAQYLSKNKNLKKENKGSITLFVLVSGFFFIVVGTSALFHSNNVKISQMKQLDKIQSEYEKDFNELEEEYNELVERKK